MQKSEIKEFGLRHYADMILELEMPEISIILVLRVYNEH